MSKQIYLITFIAIILLQACNTTKLARSMEYYDPESAMQTSKLNLPIILYKSELEKKINQQLGEIIYEDNDFSDGLLVKATRRSEITLEIIDNKVTYNVPIDLWIKKDLMITSVDAEGSLDLKFETSYDVKSDWELETKTLLEKYEWTKPPVVKLGVGNLNVTSIANQFIEKAKGPIAASIDEQVENLIDLKAEVYKAWKELQNPILVSTEHKTWLMMNTDSIQLTPLKTVGNLIESTIVVTARPRLVIGKKPIVGPPSQMPSFQYIQSSPLEDFLLFFGSEILFSEAEEIAKKNMLGETYTIGKRKVKVEDISITGRGNKLVVSTTLSGSYKGQVEFTGKPDYNDRKNEIKLKDVDFDFNTKNKLVKTASWLFKGSLKKAIQESLNFHLTENLEVLQTAIEVELKKFELSKGLTIIGDLHELNVSHVYIGTTGINVKIGLKGNMSLEIKEIVGSK